MIAYVLLVFFIWYLLNEAEISHSLRIKVLSRLPDFFLKALNCPLCFGWWTSLTAWCLNLVPFYAVWSTAVINMFLAMIYKKLV